MALRKVPGQRITSGTLVDTSHIRFVKSVLDFQTDLSFIKVVFSDSLGCAEWLSLSDLFFFDDEVKNLSSVRRIGSILDRMWDVSLTRVTFADDAGATEWVADGELFALDDYCDCSGEVQAGVRYSFAATSSALVFSSSAVHADISASAASTNMSQSANTTLSSDIEHTCAVDAALDVARAPVSRRICYGTSIVPRTSPRILLPQWTIDMLFRPSEKLDLQCSNGCVFGRLERSKRCVNYNGDYPSVSTIIGATCDYTALYKWQKRIVAENGSGHLRELMDDAARRGTAFHSLMNFVIEDLRVCGRPPSDWEIYQKSRGSKIKGYVDSVLPFIRTLKHSKCVLTESWVNHHVYFYRGRFDALFAIDGVLTLVDWKTAKAPANAVSGRDATGGLYDHPLQLAAYIMAFNADAAYHRFPIIKQGAIVQCYEDGSICRIWLMTEDMIKECFDKFLVRLNRFWWVLETTPATTGGDVSVLYSPDEERSDCLT